MAVTRRSFKQNEILKTLTQGDSVQKYRFGTKGVILRSGDTAGLEPDKTVCVTGGDTDSQ